MKRCTLLCCPPFQLIFMVGTFSLCVSKTDLSDASAFGFRFKFPVFRCCLLTSCKAGDLAASGHFCCNFWPNAPPPQPRCLQLDGVVRCDSIPCASCLGGPAVGSVSLTRLWAAARSHWAPLCASSGAFWSRVTCCCLPPPTRAHPGRSVCQIQE